MNPSLALAPLLEPIALDKPSGEPIRYTTKYDLIRELRREEDASLPMGVWQATLKRADWSAVEKEAKAVLTQQSKDLMVAIWLGESWIHQFGLVGLEAALSLIMQYCEKFWDSLHPQAQDADFSFRTSPLEFMAKIYTEILTFSTPLLKTGLPQGMEPLTLSAWRALNHRLLNNNSDKKDQQQAQQEFKRLSDFIRDDQGSELSENATYLIHSKALLSQLDTWCNAQIENDPPAFSVLSNTLDHMIQSTKEFSAMSPILEEQNITSEPEPDAPSSEKAPPEKIPPTTGPQSREDAYKQLRLIANYLSKTEPHSPVPYLIYRAVEWGEKPLRDLLAELISSDAEARRLWTLLGVLP